MRLAALELAETLGVACASAQNREHALAYDCLNQAYRDLALVEVHHVELMRSHGLTWAEIGSLSGVSKNAARQRYLRLTA